MSNRACFVALAVQVQDMVVVGEIFFSKLENRLLLEGLHESRSQRKNEGPLQVSLAGDGDSGGFLSTLQPHFPLVLPFLHIHKEELTLLPTVRPPNAFQ